jgi:hypothetical protein
MGSDFSPGKDHRWNALHAAKGFATEAALSSALRELVRWRWGHRALYRRIEDASGNLGTFDVWLLIEGRWAVVELKVDGPNAAPRMGKGQPAFGSSVLSAGGEAWVLVGHPDGSLRLLRGDTTGKDWRDRLVRRYDRLTVDVIEDMLPR